MNSSALKRIGAYLIDVFIFGAIITIISMFFQSNNLTNLNEEYRSLNESFLKSDVTMDVYYNRVALISQNIDKENFLINVINCILLVGYFVVIPLYRNGQTIGKKLLKIKIVRDDNDDLTANDLIIRNVIINGLLNTLISFCLVFLMSSLPYFIIISILAFVQVLLVIISTFMIIYRKDKKGIQDLITHTHVEGE